MNGYLVKRSYLASTTVDGRGEFLPTHVFLAYIPADRSWSWSAGFEQHAVVLSRAAAEAVAADMRRQSTTEREKSVQIEVVLAGASRSIDASADALARARRAA